MRAGTMPTTAQISNSLTFGVVVSLSPLYKWGHQFHKDRDPPRHGTGGLNTGTGANGASSMDQEGVTPGGDWVFQAGEMESEVWPQ